MSEEEDGVIEGKVVDAFGDPVENATVKAVEQNNNSIYYDTSDTDGSYKIEAFSGGEFFVTARDDSLGGAYSLQNIEVESVQGRIIVIDLRNQDHHIQ